MNNAGKRVTDGILRRLKRAKRQLVRLNEDKILEALKTCAPRQERPLLMHSSLSACGFMTDGPATVILALQRWMTDDVGLALPTHTWSYPDALGVVPIYDFSSTPSVVGTITNYFWKQTGVERSLHPSHSIAYRGPDAVTFVAEHEHCETPCGRGTPYERLIEQDGTVLMFGATLDAYTLFHTAEDATEVPYLYMPERLNLRSRDRQGKVRDIPTWRQDMGVTRRFGEMESWLESQHLLERRKLGSGTLLYIPRAGDLHKRMVTELRQDPFLLVHESIRNQVKSRY